MKRSIVVLTGLVFLVAAFFVVGLVAGDAPDTVTLKAKNGDITFPHKKHAEEISVECKECHHEMKSDNVDQSCHDCHGVDDNAPKTMKAFHNLCKACHKETNEKEDTKAPTTCKGCHVKS